MKITCNATDLSKLLGISRTAAYNLMHRADFPSFRIGKRLLIQQDKLMSWVNEQTKIPDPDYLPYPDSGKEADNIAG